MVTTGKTRGVAIVEWEASPEGDVIADAVVALLMHAQSSTASIRLTSKPCRHPRASDDVEEPSKVSTLGLWGKTELLYAQPKSSLTTQVESLQRSPLNAPTRN